MVSGAMQRLFRNTRDYCSLARALFRNNPYIPNKGLVLNQQVVRQELYVLRRVLNLAPFPLNSGPEVPIAIRPPAGSFEWFQMCLELLNRGYTVATVMVRDRIHQETHAHDASPVHQP